MRFFHQKNLISFLVFVCFATLAGCAGSPSSTIKIGCGAPLTGDQASIGIDVCRGVQLAVEEANQKGDVIPGYKLEVLLLDDQRNPAQAVNVAKKYVSDRDVIAVVAHFNSSCTKPTSAIYHEARMTQITAGSTNPDLSKQGFDTFFRVCATDDVQGPSGARYALNTLGLKTVFIIDDKTTYGKGLADEFKKEAEKIGLTVLGHESITQGDKNFTPLLTRIKPSNPELIYFGGIYPEAALLVRQARSLELNAPLMGGDGIASPTLIELASPEIAEGMYMTMVGGDIEKVPAAKDFAAAMRAKYNEVGQWAAYSYDSTNVIIDAIRRAGVKDRQAVLKAMREKASYPGITAEIKFDANGDNENRFIGIFQVKDGKLAYIGPAE